MSSCSIRPVNSASSWRITLVLRQVICMLLLLAGLAQGSPAQSPHADDDAVEQRVDGMLKKLTLNQKLSLIGGEDSFYIRALPEIGLPRLKMSDASAGVRTWGPSTAYPAPIALAATWDTSLANEVGVSLGRDSRARGVNFLLAPGVNIARAPMAGRNFEYFGEDPYLTSRLAVAYINGVQSQGVCATVKHFMMNNQEFDRHHVSSDADERTMREIYMPAFEAAVKDADVCAIMNSYNLVNGTHATQNGWMNNQVAKKEWGFRGVIMSDWMSVYDGVAAANGGLDLEMPFARRMTPEILLPAIHAGAVSETTIDDKVRRILRVAVRFGFLDRPQTLDLPLYSDDADQLALRVEQEAIVLLKNEHKLLPLDRSKTCTLAVIGPNAFPAVTGGGGSSLVTPFQTDNIVTALQDYLNASGHNVTGCKAKVVYDSGTPNHGELFDHKTFDGGMRQSVFDTKDWTGKYDRSIADFISDETHITLKKAVSVRWEGDFTPHRPGNYYVAVSSKSGDAYHVLVEGKEIPWTLSGQADSVRYFPLPGALEPGQKVSVQVDMLPTGTDLAVGVTIRAEQELLSAHALEIAKSADAVVCAVGFNRETEREGGDRTFALPLPQDVIIRELAALNPRTVVTIHSGGNVDMGSWIDKVPALLQLWYPGQAGGRALASILFGEVSPEGKLPVTFEKSWTDNPAHDHYYATPAVDDSTPHVQYAEGVFIGYRYFVGSETHPRFPFGYGLSYTRFAFSNLRLDRNKISPAEGVVAKFDVTNVGDRAGAETAQLYVGDPSATVDRPLKELKGFAKIKLAPGEKQTVTLTLTSRSFAYWSEKKRAWTVDPGRFVIYAGDSSEDSPLSAPLTVQ